MEPDQFEPLYRLPEVAKILHYNIETTRQLVRGRPGVQRNGFRGHYRVPLSVVEQIRRELSVSRDGKQRNCILDKL